MKEYIPIDCNYYDQLEALATTKAFVEIKYRSNQSQQQVTSSYILDFFIKDKVEYLKLKNGIAIRLDHILSVNGLRPPHQPSCKV